MNAVACVNFIQAGFHIVTVTDALTVPKKKKITKITNKSNSYSTNFYDDSFHMISTIAMNEKSLGGPEKK